MKIYTVSVMFQNDGEYPSVVRNTLYVIYAQSEDEAYGKGYRMIKEKKYPQGTVMNLVEIPDDHIEFAYSYLHKDEDKKGETDATA